MAQGIFRDAERTLADYEWELGDDLPPDTSPGLQPRTSRGLERDPITLDIQEYLYIGPGWQLLRSPNNDTRRIAVLETRATDLETADTAQDTRMDRLEARIVALEP